MSVRTKSKIKRGPQTAYRNSKLSIPARAAEAGMSARTLIQEISEGRGPKVTFVSPKRRVILDDNWAAWLKMRTDNPPAVVMRRRAITEPRRKAAAAAPSPA
jgi:hypothetical protein